jgi:hypothetical protein
MCDIENFCFRRNCNGCQMTEPKEMCSCDYCGDNIILGDVFVEFDDNYYHEDCFDICAAGLLLKSGEARRDVVDA